MIQVMEYEATADLYKDAAQMVVETLAARPEAVLGLATGATQVPLYRELVELYGAGRVSFRHATCVNLDEYVGLAPSDPNSYHTYMRNHFYDHVDVDPRRCLLPEGDATDLTAAAARYQRLLERRRDIQFLGIGRNGHIGFNEPNDELILGTHVTGLNPVTVADSRQYFHGSQAVPHQAVTMGVGDIFFSERIVLLAIGEDKADAIARALSGRVSTRHPASLLQLHPQAIFLVDQEAAAKLSADRKRVPARSA